MGCSGWDNQILLALLNFRAIQITVPPKKLTYPENHLCRQGGDSLIAELFGTSQRPRSSIFHFFVEWPCGGRARSGIKAVSSSFRFPRGEMWTSPAGPRRNYRPGDWRWPSVGETNWHPLTWPVVSSTAPPTEIRYWRMSFLFRCGRFLPKNDRRYVLLANSNVI